MKGDTGSVHGRIIRVKHGAGEPYTRIANALMNDPELTFTALGLISYLLSKPNDWTIRLGQLVNSHVNGRRSISTAIRLAKQLGYLRVEKRRDLRGRWMSLWLVFETRQISEDTCKQGKLFEILDEMAPELRPLAPLFEHAASDATKAAPECVSQPGAAASPARETRPGAEREQGQGAVSHLRDPVTRERAHENAPLPINHSTKTETKDHGKEHGWMGATPSAHTRTGQCAPAHLDGRDGRERDPAKDGHNRRDRRQPHQTRKRNAVGGPCIANIDDRSILSDISKLLTLYRVERNRGSIKGCETRQFVAAAVRAERVAKSQGGNPIAIFAAIVNRRGAPPDCPTKHWALIAEDEWAIAGAQLDAHRELHDPMVFVEAVHFTAKNARRDPFELAHEMRKGITRQEWELLNEKFRLAKVAAKRRGDRNVGIAGDLATIVARERPAIL